MSIIYHINNPISPDDYLELSATCQKTVQSRSHSLIQAMLDNTNLLVSAWSQEGNDAHELVGLARGVSDFRSSCHVVELLVRPDFESTEVAQMLLKYIEPQLTSGCLLTVLEKSPLNVSFKDLGFEHHNDSWVKLAD